MGNARSRRSIMVGRSFFFFCFFFFCFFHRIHDYGEGAGIHFVMKILLKICNGRDSLVRIWTGFWVHGTTVLSNHNVIYRSASGWVSFSYQHKNLIESCTGFTSSKGYNSPNRFFMSSPLTDHDESSTFLMHYHFNGYFVKVWVFWCELKMGRKKHGHCRRGTDLNHLKCGKFNVSWILHGWTSLLQVSNETT